MSLKEKAMNMNSGKGIEFMNEREKGEMQDLLNKNLTITDYSFINGDDGEYVVFIVKEDESKFYFGGKVLTENMKSFTSDDKEEIKRDGLPVIFEERKSKKTNRKYIASRFYPEN